MAHRHVVPNHFRSLRTPSTSPTSADARAAAARRTGNASPREDMKGAVGSIPNFSRIASPETPVVSAQVAAAAEARVARHAKFLAEQRAATAAKAASQEQQQEQHQHQHQHQHQYLRRVVGETAITADAAEEMASASSPLSPSSHQRVHKPLLVIDTTRGGAGRGGGGEGRGGRGGGGRGLAGSRGASPITTRVSSPNSASSPPASLPGGRGGSKAGSPLNDGSQRCQPQPHPESYRAVLAEECTELYSWLTRRQETFWTNRGL
jgi:hypothetical protein